MSEKQSNVLTGVAGEYFVAAELSKNGYLASITLRNTKGVDILVANENGDRHASIQVKTNNNDSNSWILSEKNEDDDKDHFFYVFVSLNKKNEQPLYFVVPSKVVANFIRLNHQEWITSPGKKGQTHNSTTMRKFVLDKETREKYKNKWEILDLDFNEDKFTTKAGDFKVKFSQCSNCIENVGIDQCKNFGEKPRIYSLNTSDCPSKKPD